MVSVLSSRTARESPLRCPVYLQMWRKQGLAKRGKQGKRGKEAGEMTFVPQKDVFTGIIEAVDRPRTGKKLYELMQALGYDLDQQFFYQLLETYLQAKPGQELTREDWVSLLFDGSMKAQPLQLCPESRLALISAVKYEVSKANSVFMLIFATWNRLTKTETGETARFSAVHAISALCSLPNSEVNARIERLYGRGWTLSEKKYLNLLFPIVLQRTLYTVGVLIHTWGLKAGDLALGRLIRGLVNEINMTK